MPVSSSELQRDLQALWRAKRNGRPMPLRRAFDVVELRPWLGSLCLIDIEANGRDFRYRVFGTRIANTIGQELTGRRVSEIAPQFRDGLRPGYVEVSRSARPATFAPIFHEPWRTIRLSDLVLPLSVEGLTVDMLLTCSYPV